MKKILSKGMETIMDFYDNPKKKPQIYKPTDVIDEEEWEEFKKFFSDKFITLDVNMDMITDSLDACFKAWLRGSYPNKEAFLEALDSQFVGYADMLRERKNKRTTD